MGRFAAVAITATFVVCFIFASVLKLVGWATMRSCILPLSALGAREDVADRSSPASDLAVFERCQRELCLVCLLQLEAVLRLGFWIEALAEQLPVPVPLQVVIEDPVIELLVVTVELWVGENACQHEEVAEVSSLLEMASHIW